jgi:hypothetical protein
MSSRQEETNMTVQLQLTRSLTGLYTILCCAALAAPVSAEQLEAPLELEERATQDQAAKSSLLRPALYGGLQLSAQYAFLRVYDPANWHDYGNHPTPSIEKFQSNFQRAPVFEPEAYGGGGLLGIAQADGDPWTINVVGHGIQGSEMYLRMRREGNAWWAAGLAGIAHSTLWEYGFEGVHETPSLWDMVWTPLGGALIGEARHRVLKLEGRFSDSTLYSAARWVVDPVGELDELLFR